MHGSVLAVAYDAVVHDGAGGLRKQAAPRVSSYIILFLILINDK